MLSCNIDSYLIKRQSDMYVMIVIINSNMITNKNVCKIGQSVTFLP